MISEEENKNIESDEGSLKEKAEELLNDREDEEITVKRLTSDPSEEKANIENLKKLAKKFLDDREGRSFGSK